MKVVENIEMFQQSHLGFLNGRSLNNTAEFGNILRFNSVKATEWRQSWEQN